MSSIPTDIIRAINSGDVTGLKLALMQANSPSIKDVIKYVDENHIIGHLISLPDDLSIDMMNFLFNLGADPNKRNKYRDSLIFLACCLYSHKKLECLLKHKADISIKFDYDQLSPMHVVASRRNSIKHMMVLHKYGAEIDPKDFEGKTPLYYAIFEKLTHNVEFLVSIGASVNVTDSLGCDMLTYLVENVDSYDNVLFNSETINITKILLHNGALIKKSLLNKIRRFSFVENKFAIIIKQVDTIFFLALAHHFDQDSILHCDYCPRDLFMTIFKLFLSND